MPPEVASGRASDELTSVDASSNLQSLILEGSQHVEDHAIEVFVDHDVAGG